jgi:hypothetical protein
MNCDLGQQTKKSARIRTLFLGGLVLASAFGTVTLGAAQNVTAPAAQNVTPPTTPAIITPPAGSTAFLVGHAKGTQGYVCLPTSAGASTASWTVNGARPEATLFANLFGKEVQILAHFLSPDTNPNQNAPNPLPFGSPTWQSSIDSSRGWGQVLHSIPAGSDPVSCPNTGAIPCLLLQSIGTDQGPTGGKLLVKTTFMQRLNTRGGSAPADGCSTSADVGKQALVPYTADYYFFHGRE